jgi:hypothetical protein
MRGSPSRSGQRASPLLFPSFQGSLIPWIPPGICAACLACAWIGAREAACSPAGVRLGLALRGRGACRTPFPCQWLLAAGGSPRRASPG